MLVQFVLVLACRLYLISGERIAMLERSLGARPIGVSLVIRACRDIGAGAAHDQPYKLFGYGVALKQHWHVQNKVALLSWIEKVGASKVSHFHLCDAKPSADLMQPHLIRPKCAG